MNQGQISDIIRWKKDNYMIQKVIDDVGNLHLQIMKIPLINVHYTPNFNTKKSFQLASNDNGDPDFFDLGANPEGRVWIQYNQYIYFYTVANLWNGGENNKYKLTRKCYNLMTEELKIDKDDFNEIGQTDVNIDYL